MNIRINNYDERKFIPKFQEGGAMPPEGEPMPEEQMAPAQEQGGSPEEQLLMACQQAVQSNDCQLALQVCAAVLQMIGGGGGEEAPQAPEGQAPVYRKGGRLVRWQSK